MDYKTSQLWSKQVGHATRCASLARSGEVSRKLFFCLENNWNCSINLTSPLQYWFTWQESDSQTHIATVRDRGRFRWHIDQLSTEIVLSWNLWWCKYIGHDRCSVDSSQFQGWLKLDFEELIIKQRSLQCRGGSALSNNELLEYLEPPHRFSIVIESLIGIDNTKLSANPLNLKPFFSGWISLKQKSIWTVPSIQLKTISRPRVIFPTHEDFVWHHNIVWVMYTYTFCGDTISPQYSMGDVHNVRWYGISRGSFVKIMLLWQDKIKAKENVLVHHVASFGSLPFRMPNDCPVGKSFRIHIICKSRTHERADSCSFAIQTKLKDSDNCLRSTHHSVQRYDLEEFLSAPCMTVATASRAYSVHIKSDYAQRRMHTLWSLLL
jgi:hypothetical protein